MLIRVFTNRQIFHGDTWNYLVILLVRKQGCSIALFTTSFKFELYYLMFLLETLSIQYYLLSDVNFQSPSLLHNIPVTKKKLFFLLLLFYINYFFSIYAYKLKSMPKVAHLSVLFSIDFYLVVLLKQVYYVNLSVNSSMNLCVSAVAMKIKEEKCYYRALCNV